VLTGGDTARSVLDTLGIGWLRVAGEIEPGVPLCFAGSSPRPSSPRRGVRRSADPPALPDGDEGARVSKPRIAITMGDAAGVGPRSS
jgi:hypothetical protein